MSYVIWDEETTIKSLNKRKASPFHPENHVVVSGWKRKGMPAPVADYFGRVRPTGDWFTKLLEGTKMLVGFNIKFDLLHAIYSKEDQGNYEAWRNWVAEGGQIWDCQLAEYLLHGMSQENQMLSLDEVAPRYGGHLKDDAVKALWAAGIDTTEIDKDLLIEYLIGAEGEERDLGDIGNTELVFLGQVAAFRARGGLRSALLNMDSLICTIEMELNGMHVNKTLGLELAAQIEAQLKELHAELNEFLPKDLPFEFRWTRFQLSALVFGGKVKYVAKANVLDDDGALTYYQKKEKHYVLNDGTTTATPPAGADVLNYATFAGGKNKGEYKTKQVTVPDLERGPKQRNEDFYYEFEGYTEPDPAWATATEGVYSTAGDVIAALANRDIPFLKQLGLMSSMTKDLGTYYITTDEDTGEQKGMLTLVGSDGIIHHSLNHTSTVTGRFSSSNPNLQNIPKEGKSLVKTIFDSRFDKGRVVQSDFTALEIYIQALLTNDSRLISDLIGGMDMHCLRASITYKADYDFVVLVCDDKTHPEHKLWSKRRTNAKVFSFQRAYGAGAQKIALTTGMELEEVQALIEAEELLYPTITAYYNRVTETVAANRVPTQRFVQHPEIPGVTCQLGRSHFVTPDGKMYSYSESPSPGWLVRQKKITQSFSPTEIKNYVVQGTGGEWAKAAMGLVVRAFYAHKNFGNRALLVNQVHDAVYLDAAPEVEVEAAAMLHACMEEASTFMEYYFKWKVPVPVPTVTMSGDNMMEEQNMPAVFEQHVASAKKWVRDRFMPNYKPTFEG